MEGIIPPTKYQSVTIKIEPSCHKWRMLLMSLSLSPSLPPSLLSPSLLLPSLPPSFSPPSLPHPSTVVNCCNPPQLPGEALLPVCQPAAHHDPHLPHTHNQEPGTQGTLSRLTANYTGTGDRRTRSRSYYVSVSH